MSWVTPEGKPIRATQTIAGVVVALAGSGLMIAATFLPWMKANGKALSGYDIWDVQNQAGENPFFTLNMFSDFSPFVTGLTTLLAGAAWVLLALLVVVVPKVPPPSRRYVPAWFSALVLLPVIVVAVTLGFNLSALSSNAAADLGVAMELGLFVLAGGMVVSGLGFAFAISRPGAPMLRSASST